MLAQRKRQCPTEGVLHAQSLTRHLIEHPCHEQARCLATYLAMPGEMSLDPAIRIMLQQRKLVCVPRVAGQQLVLQRIDDMDHWTTGAYGLREPVADPDRVRPIERIDLILIPLVAVDRHGHRIGMGGGYYDRLLADAGRTPLRVGVAYGWQIVDNIDPQPWDVPLHGLITEQGWTWF